jgi:hypothetical protein
MSRGAGPVLEHVFELKNFLKNLNVYFEKTIMEILAINYK